MRELQRRENGGVGGNSHKKCESTAPHSASGGGAEGGGEPEKRKGDEVRFCGKSRKKGGRGKGRFGVGCWWAAGGRLGVAC